MRDALVVSAGRHRDDAGIDDTDDSGASGHDAPAAANNAAGFDTAAAGHVFCLTALMMDVRHHAP